MQIAGKGRVNLQREIVKFPRSICSEVETKILLELYQSQASNCNFSISFFAVDINKKRSDLKTCLPHIGVFLGMFCPKILAQIVLLVSHIFPVFLFCNWCCLCYYSLLSTKDLICHK